MKKQKNIFKIISIIVGIIGILASCLIVFLGCIFILMGGLNKEEVITDTSKYQEVIGINTNILIVNIKINGECQKKYFQNQLMN